MNIRVIEEPKVSIKSTVVVPISDDIVVYVNPDMPIAERQRIIENIKAYYGN